MQYLATFLTSLALACSLILSTAAEMTPAEIRSVILHEWAQDSAARRVTLKLRADKLTPEGLLCTGYKLEPIPTNKRNLDGSRMVTWTPSRTPHDAPLLITGLEAFAHAMPHDCGIVTLYPVRGALDHASAQPLLYALTADAAAAARWKLERDENGKAKEGAKK